MSETNISDEALANAIQWNEQGLVPVIAQDASNEQVLMMAWMDREALAETLATGKMVYYSRSRQGLWRKGDTSGHVQWVTEIYLDCDGDTLLARVDQVGGACHAGYRSCFFRALAEDGALVEVAKPIFDAKAAYGSPGSQLK